MGQQPSRNSLNIKVTLGQTQSHQLFDFQNGGLQQQAFMIQSSSYLVDKGETVQFFNQQQYELNKDMYINQQTNILNITVDNYKQITIKNLSTNNNNHHSSSNNNNINNNISNNQTILWRCVKPNQPHSIRPGNVIKIGKIKLQLKKIVQTKEQSYVQQETVKDYHQQASQQYNNSNNDHINNNNNNNNNNDDLQSMRSGHSSCDRCRICFRSFNVKNDPLLCLCKCSGSIKWIHFLCLKDWIANNFQKRQDQHCKFYTYQQTNCQLCKHSLPNQFKHEGRSYSFLDFGAFQPPYAQFQYSQVQLNNKRKYYKYIISLSRQKQVMIGRNNSSQVVMKDISISRTHCSLQYNHGMLLLRDKKSKFGTLIKLQRQFQFSGQSGLQLQFDSKIIELFDDRGLRLCCQDVGGYKVVYQDGSNNSSSSNDYIKGDRQQAGRQYSRLNTQNNNNNIPILIPPNFNNSDQNQNSNNPNQWLTTTMNNRVSEVNNNNSQENMLSNSLMYLNQGMLNVQEETNSARGMTMVRDTIARDEAIRY